MKLDDTDKQRLISYYKNALLKHGPLDPQSVHWSTEYSQLRRFDILSHVGELENKSILDVGCGTGELYNYLANRGIKTSYTGIDIVPDFINAARARFPDAMFEEKNILDVTKKYDYVLASGTLSFKVKQNDDYYKNIIRKMHGLANVAVAFNMLEKFNHIDNETYAAYSPKEISDFCRTIASRIEVVIGYLEGDFTVYMYT